MKFSTPVTLQLHELSQFFADQIVFANLNFSCPAGTITTLEGANGVGKTTLLRIVAGHLRPSRGDVLLGAQRLHAIHGVRGRICEISHEPRAYADLSVQENLELAVRLQGISEMNARVDRALAKFGAIEFRTRLIKFLSKGQQLRVSLALALLQDAPILLLDEPTSSLDPAGTALLFDFLKEERARGAIILVATHDQKLWDSLADQRLQLSHAKARVQ